MPLLYVDLIEGRAAATVLRTCRGEPGGRDPADLIVSITENGDDDWSFGYARAQFKTGELS
jgi:hypothetical protein